MNSSERKLAAHLLRMAADSFSNHGCNDLDLSQIVPDPDERNAIVRSMHEWNGDPEEYEVDDSVPDYRLQDWLAMDLMAHKLESEDE